MIEALNRDLSFDKFTIAQLAGDLEPHPDVDDRIATACHRSTQTNEEGGTDDEQFRLEAAIDRVHTTWQVWQGLTFGCVQCHSHPYDPIRHTEYYECLSYFNNTVDTDLSNDDPRIDVPLNPGDYERANELDNKIAGLREQDWQSGYRLLRDASLWHPAFELRASTTTSTKVVVEGHEGVAEYRTEGTVAKETGIVMETPIPEGLKSVTAIRFTGLPHDPQRAVADSEWGFVLSHVEAAVLVPGDDSPRPITIFRVIGDEPHPLYDPQLSLNAGIRRGSVPTVASIKHGKWPLS